MIRESIQTHRQIIWAFAGSHAVDELTEAPWTSYLVSARTLEVTPFEPEETRLLLTEPLKHSTLWRDAEVRRPFRDVEEQDVPEDEAVARSLRRRRLVQVDGGRFHLRVPLMARWLRERI